MRNPRLTRIREAESEVRAAWGHLIRAASLLDGLGLRGPPRNNVTPPPAVLQGTAWAAAHIASRLQDHLGEYVVPFGKRSAACVKMVKRLREEWAMSESKHTRENSKTAGRWCLHCEDAIPESALKCPSCGEVTEAGKLRAFPKMLEALRKVRAALGEASRGDIRYTPLLLEADDAIAAATGGRS